MPPQRQSAKKEQVNGSIFIHITKTIIEIIEI